jgi:hypothetical protein
MAHELRRDLLEEELGVGTTQLWRWVTVSEMNSKYGWRTYVSNVTEVNTEVESD